MNRKLQDISDDCSRSPAAILPVGCDGACQHHLNICQPLSAAEWLHSFASQYAQFPPAGCTFAAFTFYTKLAIVKPPGLKHYQKFVFRHASLVLSMLYNSTLGIFGKST